MKKCKERHQFISDPTLNTTTSNSHTNGDCHSSATICFYPLSSASFIGSDGVISLQSKKDLSTFIATSVLPRTNRTYEGHWNAWKQFLKSELNQDDPFLRALTEDEKASLVSIMMLRKHQAGHRGKAATSFTAGIRMRFAQETLPTGFLDSAVVATARTSCLMKPEELRAKRNSAPSCTIKLPICESVLVEMRQRLWVGRTWGYADLALRMTYPGCMYGFELSARVGEFTYGENGGTDHCIRTDDLSFAIETPLESRSVVGSELADLPQVRAGEGYSQIVQCRVLGASTKGKATVKAKLIGRRSPEESEFMDDLIDFIVHARSKGDEELFSFRKEDGSRTVLKARTVREELKDTCRKNGLPPNYFSAHSLRKGAITHMRALGASEDDRRDRGNYAPNSQVMNETYDYATGLGPLASNSLEGGHKPTLSDVMRLIPAVRLTL